MCILLGLLCLLRIFGLFFGRVRLFFCFRVGLCFLLLFGVLCVFCVRSVLLFGVFVLGCRFLLV